MKFLSGIFGGIIILLAVSFALANRQSATISLWPLGVEIEAPLYLLTLGTFFFGVLVGAFIAWLNLLPHRFRARQLQKDLRTLQDKVVDLQQTVIPPGDGAVLPGPKPKWRWGSQS